LNEEENTSIEQRRRDEEILIREEEERLRFEEEQMMRFEMMRFEEQMMRFEMMRFEEKQQRIRFEEEQQRIRMEEERVMGTEDTTNIEDTTSIQNTLNMIEDFKNRLGLWIRNIFSNNVTIKNHMANFLAKFSYFRLKQSFFRHDFQSETSCSPRERLTPLPHLQSRTSHHLIFYDQLILFFTHHPPLPTLHNFLDRAIFTTPNIYQIKH
jgi:hypothetical protein